MKHFIIFLFTATSVFSQSQFKTGDIITAQDKLRFLDSLNKYRKMYGIHESKYSFTYEEISSIRISTLRKHIQEVTYEKCKDSVRKHLHYNFMEDFCKFNISNLPLDTKFGWKGECTYAVDNNYIILKKKDLVSELFTAWKESPDHWNNMLDPDFKYISLAFEYKDGLIISVLNSFELECINTEKKLCIN